MITSTTITKQNNGSTDIEKCKKGTKCKIGQIEEEKSPIRTQCKHGVEEESLEGPRFCPALYIQRYGFIRHVLEKHDVTSVVDFGCAECKILTLIKTVKSLEKILLVDIDDRLLQSREYCIRPSFEEFIHHRDNPLHIQLLAGSAAILDERIAGVEAVTLVEVIEHLTEDILIEVTENIFNNIQPRLVIITTPNSDFNVLFPNLTGVRHWDHKFEWSRKQFQHWCDTVCRKYDYTVEVTGIGEPPDGSQHVGFCSQAAIFTSLETNRKPTQIPTINYKVISEYHYPYKEKKLSLEEELDIEVLYFIRRQCLLALNDQSGESSITIPIHDLLNIKFVRNLSDPKFFRTYIQKKFTISQDNVVIDITDFVDTDRDSSDDNFYDNELDDGVKYYNENIVYPLALEEPDWD